MSYWINSQLISFETKYVLDVKFNNIDRIIVFNVQKKNYTNIVMAIYEWQVIELQFFLSPINIGDEIKCNVAYTMLHINLFISFSSQFKRY
jgi:hypothetical protein